MFFIAWKGENRSWLYWTSLIKNIRIFVAKKTNALKFFCHYWITVDDNMRKGWVQFPAVCRRSLGATRLFGIQSQDPRALEQSVDLLHPCPVVCLSGGEGQRKPAIIVWKEMIIYHPVIRGDWVTGPTAGGAAWEQERIEHEPNTHQKIEEQIECVRLRSRVRFVDTMQVDSWFICFLHAKKNIIII